MTLTLEEFVGVGGLEAAWNSSPGPEEDTASSVGQTDSVTGVDDFDEE